MTARTLPTATASTPTAGRSRAFAQPPEQHGVARLYDHHLRLLAAVYGRASGPTANLDHGLMLSYGAVVTFTRTATVEQARELLTELHPMFRPGPWLDQPGGRDYLAGDDFAQRANGDYAEGGYVETCPTCGARPHTRCRADGVRLDDPHTARDALARERATERKAAFDADAGSFVWTSRRPLRRELRRGGGSR